MLNSRKSTTQSNQNPGELLYYHLKNKCKHWDDRRASDERKAKIKEIRLTPNGIETIKEAMKVDHPIFDQFQAELKPLEQARSKAEYDHWETRDYDRSEGTTIDVGVGGEAARLDSLIWKVKWKYDPLLVIYNELDYAVREDKQERELAEAAIKVAAERKETEDEFNNILELTRGRCLGK